MKRIKILAIVGSLRKDSYNRQLALMAHEIVGDRADFSILEYSDIPVMNQDIEFPAPESIKRIRDEVLSADALWLFTPEYNHYFPGVLKNLLDWLSRPLGENQPPLLANKPTAISGITPGMSGTAIAQDHLVTLISLLNMDVMNMPRLTIPNAMKQLDDDGKLILQKSKGYLEKQTDAFIDYVQSRV